MVLKNDGRGILVGEVGQMEGAADSGGPQIGVLCKMLTSC